MTCWEAAMAFCYKKKYQIGGGRSEEDEERKWARLHTCQLEKAG
jgi:hypothetical protein